MLLIDERFDEAGHAIQTHLEVVRPGDGHAAAGAARVHLTCGALDGLLPVAAVETVMRRYGRPLAEDIVADGPALELGGGRVLQHLRYRSPVDASARDYLVWRAPGEEPLAALSNGVAAALRHLVAAMTSIRG